jgi:viroplasmin and RNaseH domain-containing protein
MAPIISNALQTFINVRADINHNEEAKSNQQKKKWYAIAVGKTARSTGIYSSWAAAQVEVNRVSGACYARFHTYKEAKKFLREHQIQKKRQAQHEQTEESDDF